MINTKQPIQTKTEHANALALERRRILGLTPDKALEAISDHDYPVTLVQSFAEEDLYLLVYSIGPDDAQSVLAMASNDQWEYLLDMEIWSRDRIDLKAMTQWLGRLLMADADRFTHWIVGPKLDELEYFLARNTELVIREHDQDPSDFGDGFFSEDQTHFVRLRDYPAETQAARTEKETRDTLVRDMLRRISVFDYPKYISMLIQSAGMITAEAEEELYRLRNVRLAEKGFLPFDEAVGIYQPLQWSDLVKRPRKSEMPGGRPTVSYPLPVEGTAAKADANLFSRTLAQFQDEAMLQRLQTEFAGLCNQVIAADQRQVREKEALQQVVRKVGDYISIALEKAAAENPDEDPFQTANLIQTYLLSDLFRFGYGCALALKWETQRWYGSSWFAGAGLPLSFWGENWLGTLGGVMLKKPLFFDNYKNGVLYREFATLTDIHHTEAILKEIFAFDDLLSLMNIPLDSSRSYGFLTYKSLLLTHWANHYLDMPGKHRTVLPLELDQFKTLFSDLWQKATGARRIRNAMKKHFLGWLAARSGLTAYEISDRMGSALERLFGDIENELGAVAVENLDPRYIHLFLFMAPS